MAWHSAIMVTTDILLAMPSSTQCAGSSIHDSATALREILDGCRAGLSDRSMPPQAKRKADQQCSLCDGKGPNHPDQGQRALTGTHEYKQPE